MTEKITLSESLISILVGQGESDADTAIPKYRNAVKHLELEGYGFTALHELRTAEDADSIIILASRNGSVDLFSSAPTESNDIAYTIDAGGDVPVLVQVSSSDGDGVTYTVTDDDDFKTVYARIWAAGRLDAQQIASNYMKGKSDSFQVHYE